MNYHLSIIVMLCLALTSLPATANLVKIVRTGTTYPTISAAVSAALDGDVLNVATGVYEEQVVVASAGLTIEGGYDAACSALLPGERSMLKSYSIYFQSPNSTNALRNFVVTGSLDSGVNAMHVELLQCGSCIVTNNEVQPANAYGGGLYIDGAAVVLSNTVIQDNRALYGGGAGVIVNGTLVMDDLTTVISGNSADKGGGVALVNSSLMAHNGARIAVNTAGTCGGGVYVDGGTMTVEDYASIGWVDAAANSVTNGAGGGVYAEHGAIVEVGPNGRIAGNTASGNGGGVCLSNATLRLTSGSLGEGLTPGTIWTNLAGGNGGGVYAMAGSTVSIASISTVVGGCALSGGGIYMAGGVLTLDSAAIQNNISTNGHGGGLYLEQDTQWQATNVLVADNASSGYGGGFFFGIVPGAGGMQLDHVVVSNNVAVEGGGGGNVSGTNVTVVRNSLFVLNRAGWSGGLQVEGGSVELDAVRIAGNSARGHVTGMGGGGIGSIGGSLIMRNCTVLMNEADSDGDGIGNGGGLYTCSSVEPSLVTIEASASLSAWGLNHAANGGAVFAEGDATVTMAAASGYAVSCVLNTASNGAAVFLLSNACLQSVGALTLAGNNAEVDGGGICASDASCFLLTSNGFSSLILGNTAGNNGGGVALFDDSTFSAFNSRFEDNESTNNGGAIYVASGDAAIAADFSGLGPLTEPPCIFRNNRAGGNGGALNAAFNTARISVEDVLVVSNTAGSGGGAYVMDGSLAMANAVVAHNGGTHAVNGFGGSKVQLTQCTIADNEGGGVQAMNELGMTNCIAWGNSGTQVSGGAGSDVSYSDVQGGGMTGTNNLDADPLFADTNTLNYQLTAGSPCTNTGVALAGIVTNDCIGVERPQVGGWDMGAYEFVPEPAAGVAATMCLLVVLVRKGRGGK